MTTERIARCLHERGRLVHCAVRVTEGGRDARPPCGRKAGFTLPEVLDRRAGGDGGDIVGHGGRIPRAEYGPGGFAGRGQAHGTGSHGTVAHGRRRG